VHWCVSYDPLSHSRHNAGDRSTKVGHAINSVTDDIRQHTTQQAVETRKTTALGLLHSTPWRHSTLGRVKLDTGVLLLQYGFILFFFRLIFMTMRVRLKLLSVSFWMHSKFRHVLTYLGLERICDFCVILCVYLLLYSVSLRLSVCYRLLVTERSVYIYLAEWLGREQLDGALDTYRCPFWDYASTSHGLPVQWVWETAHAAGWWEDASEFDSECSASDHWASAPACCCRLRRSRSSYNAAVHNHKLMTGVLYSIWKATWFVDLCSITDKSLGKKRS